jgi:predicted phosphodiesterase
MPLREEVVRELQTTKSSPVLEDMLGIPQRTIRDWRNNGIPLISPHFDDIIEIPNMTLDDEIKKVLKSKRMNIVELCDYLNVPPKVATEAIERLKGEHLLVNETQGMFELNNQILEVEPSLKIDFHKYKETEYPIGMIADTHLISKYCRLDVLNSLYDRFAEEGIEYVYVAGNLFESENRYNKHELLCIGVENQLKYVVDNYPQRKGITTRFITGDDHEGWIIQREHINIGKRLMGDAILAGRTDLEYIGHVERDIEFAQPYGSATMRVAHMGGGSAYATSYAPQKYVESLQGGEKPSIIEAGHYHKFDYNYPREVHVIQPGCTQDQNNFARKNKLQYMVGGCKAWLTQNELGVFTSVKVEWMPYYDRRFYQFQW